MIISSVGGNTDAILLYPLEAGLNTYRDYASQFIYPTLQGVESIFVSQLDPGKIFPRTLSRTRNAIVA